MDLAIATHGLVRTFGDFTAVSGIDLAVPKGTLHGFLGPNGAGKSTTINGLAAWTLPLVALMVGARRENLAPVAQGR